MLFIPVLTSSAIVSRAKKTHVISQINTKDVQLFIVRFYDVTNDKASQTSQRYSGQQNGVEHITYPLQYT